MFRPPRVNNERGVRLQGIALLCMIWGAGREGGIICCDSNTTNDVCCAPVLIPPEVVCTCTRCARCVSCRLSGRQASQTQLTVRFVCVDFFHRVPLSSSCSGFTQNRAALRSNFCCGARSLGADRDTGVWRHPEKTCFLYS